MRAYLDLNENEQAIYDALNSHDPQRLLDLRDQWKLNVIEDEPLFDLVQRLIRYVTGRSE